MGRVCIDCRDYPSDINCSVSLCADSPEELIEAVVEHGTKVHGYQDTAEFREMIRKDMKVGNLLV